MQPMAKSCLSHSTVAFRRLLSMSKSTNIIQSSESPGPLEASIVSKLVKEFEPLFLKVANDSRKHQHHSAMKDAENTQESHFRVEIVSDKFEGKNMPNRHRLVYGVLDHEFKNDGLHALQLKTRTTAEKAAAKR